MRNCILFTEGVDVVSEMQVKPYNVYVTVAYPPDTDTPGFAEENKTKVSMPLCALFRVLNVGNPFSPFSVFPPFGLGAFSSARKLSSFQFMCLQEASELSGTFI